MDKNKVDYDTALTWALSSNPRLKEIGRQILELMDEQDINTLEFNRSDWAKILDAQQLAKNEEELAADSLLRKEIAEQLKKEASNDFVGSILSEVGPSIGSGLKGALELGTVGGVGGVAAGGGYDMIRAARGKGRLLNLLKNYKSMDAYKSVGKGMGKAFLGGAAAGGGLGFFANVGAKAFAANPYTMAAQGFLTGTEAGRGSSITDRPGYLSAQHNEHLSRNWENSDKIDWSEFELNADNSGLATFDGEDGITYLKSKNGDLIPINFVGETEKGLSLDSEFLPTKYYQLGDRNMYLKLEPGSTSYKVNTPYSHKQGGKMKYNYFKEGGRFIPKALYGRNAPGRKINVLTGEPLNKEDASVGPITSANALTYQTPYGSLVSSMTDGSGNILYSNFDTREKVDTLERTLAANGGDGLSKREERGIRRYGKWNNEYDAFIADHEDLIKDGLFDNLAFGNLSAQELRRWNKINRKVGKYEKRVASTVDRFKGSRYGIDGSIIREGQEGYNDAFDSAEQAKQAKQSITDEDRSRYLGSLIQSDYDKATKEGTISNVPIPEAQLKTDGIFNNNNVTDQDLYQLIQALQKDDGAKNWKTDNVSFNNKWRLEHDVTDDQTGLTVGDKSKNNLKWALAYLKNNDQGAYNNVVNKLAGNDNANLRTKWGLGDADIQVLTPTLQTVEDYYKANQGKYAATINDLDVLKWKNSQSQTTTARNDIKSKFNKQGGKMNKYQQGGAAPAQGGLDMQTQVAQLVQAAMSGDEQATQTINKIMEAAKQGDLQAMQIALMIQQIAQLMQGQAQAAKRGAKLSYIHQLATGCPEGTEPAYYKKGGRVCKACVEKAKKASEGTVIPEEKCGGKTKKKYFLGGSAKYDEDLLAGRKPVGKNEKGEDLYLNGDGKKITKPKKHANGGVLSLLRSLFDARK